MSAARSDAAKVGNRTHNPADRSEALLLANLKGDLSQFKLDRRAALAMQAAGRSELVNYFTHGDSPVYDGDVEAMLEAGQLQHDIIDAGWRSVAERLQDWAITIDSVDAARNESMSVRKQGDGISKKVLAAAAGAANVRADAATDPTENARLLELARIFDRLKRIRSVDSCLNALLLNVDPATGHFATDGEPRLARTGRLVLKGGIHSLSESNGTKKLISQRNGGWFATVDLTGCELAVAAGLSRLVAEKQAANGTTVDMNAARRLQNDLNDGVDVYQQLADRLGLSRSVAKVGVLLSLYGGGAALLHSSGVGHSKIEAKRIQTALWADWAGVKSLETVYAGFHAENRCVPLPDGRFVDAKLDDSGNALQFTLLNSLIQGTGASVLASMIDDCVTSGLGRPVLTVHDSMVYVADTHEQAVAIARRLRRIVENWRRDWLPGAHLRCTAGVGQDLSCAEDVD